MTFACDKITVISGFVGDWARRVFVPVTVIWAGMAAQARDASAVSKVLPSMLQVAPVRGRRGDAMARAAVRRGRRMWWAILILLGKMELVFSK